MLAPLLQAIRLRAVTPPALVGIAGAVAVGKSTLAASLADALAPLSVAVVGTDGFLLPNATLQTLGIFDRKGFPESHDLAALRGFLTQVRQRVPADAPVYSHTDYDVVSGCVQRVEAVDALILEGVVALEPSVAPLLDIRIFLDAEPDDNERWYHERRARLYGDDPGVRERGDRLWASVNVPNFDGYIRPTRTCADWIVHKAADHSLREVTRHAR